jgi:Mg/Co/Ni transporter MgtE
MSPRAAWRLESIGFGRVYDYVAGKADWGSFGLPLEGKRDSGNRVGARLHTDVPTCTLEESLRDVCERVRAAACDTCFVVNEQRIVLGRLGRAALRRDDDVTVEEAMTAGPSTVRPSLDLAAALERMRAQNLTSLPVTRSDGVLLGLIRRGDAERALESS